MRGALTRHCLLKAHCLIPSFPNWLPGPRVTVQIVSHPMNRVVHANAKPQQGRTRKGHTGLFKPDVEGLGHTEQASPSGHSLAKLEEIVDVRPLPHVSAETVSPAHAATTAASIRVLRPRGPGPILALHPDEALALPSVRIALAPCCTTSIAARLASLCWHV